MQRRLRQWKCSCFSSPPEPVDIPVRNRDGYSALCIGGFGGDEGQFAAVLQHFSASVHLDDEAQGGGDAPE